MTDDYNGTYWHVAAEVPVWWIRKLQRERAAGIDWNKPVPTAQKPW